MKPLGEAFFTERHLGEAFKIDDDNEQNQPNSNKNNNKNKNDDEHSFTF